METLREGSADIYLSAGVFFNPKMKTLRDISVLFLDAAGLKGRLLDCTAATGVRGIRYAKEAGFSDIVSLDINRDAAKSANRNIKRNKLMFKCLNASVQAYCSSGLAEKFDVIDLDPFGTPVPYINDILKVSRDNTVLMITATDTAVLCGAHSNACLKLYGSKPMHNELCKESGIRVLLCFIARAASQYNFGIETLLSISDMHYMRVFLRLHSGAKKAVDSVRQCGFATFCKKCRSFSYAAGIAPILEHKCKSCGAETEAFGPMYLGALYDKNIVKTMLHRNAYQKKGSGIDTILSRIYNEFDVPFFYSIPKATGILHMSSVPMDNVFDTLRKGNFTVSRTQFDKDGIKTDASQNDVANAIRSRNYKSSA